MVAELVKKNCERFITVFTRAWHWLVLRARWIFISSNPICLRYILILSSYVRVSIPSDIFPLESLEKHFLWISVISCCLKSSLHFVEM
jgi:hypothetical protein